MKTSFVAVLVTAAMAVPLAAQQYVCKVRNTGNGFISSVVALDLNMEAGTATGFDIFVREVYGKPIATKVRQRSANPNPYRIQWIVNTIPPRPTPLRVSFQAVLDVTTNTILVPGSARRVSNAINGNGPCATRAANSG